MGTVVSRRALAALAWLSLLVCAATWMPIAQAQAASEEVPQLSTAFPAAAGPAKLTAEQLAVPTRQLSVLVAHLDHPPRALDPMYRQAGSRFGVPWQVLAAINAIETNSGRDLTTNPAVGLGWMRFVPATWQMYAISATGRSQPVPYDPNDAILTAARFLAANGARHDLPRAIFAYNNAAWYVQAVLREASRLGGPASWRHLKLRPAVVRLGPTQAAASSITLRDAITVARSPNANAMMAQNVPAALSPVSGALIPQASWNPQLRPIAGWIVPILQWASEHGWAGVVTSGYRTYAEQAAINALGLYSAPAGSSNHETTAYPGGAVDVSEPAQLSRVLERYPGPLRLVGGVLGPVDPEHFSATGH